MQYLLQGEVFALLLALVLIMAPAFAKGQTLPKLADLGIALFVSIVAFAAGLAYSVALEAVGLQHGLPPLATLHLFSVLSNDLLAHLVIAWPIASALLAIGLSPWCARLRAAEDRLASTITPRIYSASRTP